MTKPPFGRAFAAAPRAASGEALPNGDRQNGLRQEAGKSPAKPGDSVPPHARSQKYWLIPARARHFPSLSPACSPPRRRAPTAAAAPASSSAPRGFDLPAPLRRPRAQLQLRPTAGPSWPGRCRTGRGPWTRRRRRRGGPGRWGRGRPRGGCGGTGPTATSPRRRSRGGGARVAARAAGAPRGGRRCWCRPAKGGGRRRGAGLRRGTGLGGSSRARLRSFGATPERERERGGREWVTG